MQPMNDQDYRELLLLALAGSKASARRSADRRDALRLRVLNSAAGVRLALEGRILRFDGIAHPFAFEFTPTTDRTEATSLALPGDGFLLNLAVRASAGTPRVGQCFCTVEMVRGQTGATSILGALAAGYVTDTQRLPWPGSPTRHSSDGPGVLRGITGTDPAAGVEITEVVPTNARWHLLMMRAALLTSATVANRFPQFVVLAGASGLFRSDPSGPSPQCVARHFRRRRIASARRDDQ
jgi:hypothetical protein